MRLLSLKERNSAAIFPEHTTPSILAVSPEVGSLFLIWHLSSHHRTELAAHEAMVALRFLAAVSGVLQDAWHTNQKDFFLKYTDICEDTAAITPRV